MSKNMLFLVSQNERRGYDTYDSMVVCAETEAEARQIHPSGEFDTSRYSDWASSPDAVQVEAIGIAKPSLSKGVVISSFNAG